MGLGIWVGIYYRGFWELYLVASSKHVFSNYWGWHSCSWEPISALPGVDLVSCLSARCMSMGTCHRKYCTPPFSSASLGQGLSDGPAPALESKRAKSDHNCQETQHSTDWLWQAMNVRDSHWWPCCLLLIPWDRLWEAVPRDESDRLLILLEWLLYAFFFLSSTLTWGGKCLWPASPHPLGTVTW